MKHLYAHQQKIIDEDPKKCGLFLGTGAGKTRTALLLARGEILVICPKTQKEDQNWEREYKKIVVDKLEKYSKWQAYPVIKPRLTVMSKEEFRRDAHALPRFDTVIVDEAHTCLGVTPNIRYRNRQPIPKASQLYEALEAFLARTKPERLYLCTATIMKSPMTVWGAWKLLGTAPMDFYKFRDLFYTKLPMPGRDVYAPKKTKDIKDKLGAIVKAMGYIGRLDEFFDVPEQTFITKYIELTKEQKDRIKDLHLDYPDPLVRIGKRHQIENGVLAGDEFSSEETFTNGKIDKILELAEEFPRMIVFAKYTAQIEQIKSALLRAGYMVLKLTGDTKDRGDVIELANEQQCIFIAQAQISAGWELPEYPVMVFASRTYSWVDYEQSLGRIQRANAIKKNLYINLVVKGGVDDAVDKALANKADFNERMYIYD